MSHRLDSFKVIAIIPGGGYKGGAASNKPQNAEALAGVGDVIVVSFNYRLGVLGFADMNGLAPGNLGLHDQRLALQWIRDNIAEFGGDPTQVTVIGLSAGAMSVAAQILTIVDKENPFQAAVLDAGVVGSYGFLEDSESSFARTQKVAKEVGCPVDSDKIVECLRKAPVSALLASSANQTGTNRIEQFVATTDGVFLPKDVEKYLHEGSADLRKIRSIIGYSRDEGSMFVNLADKTFNFSSTKTSNEIVDYCVRIADMFNYPFDGKKAEIREKIGKLYVDENSGIAVKAIASFFADGIFKCPGNDFIESYSRHNDKVFAYQFNRLLSRTYFKVFNPKTLGAFHISAFLHFAGALSLDEKPLEDADKQYAIDAMTTISNFAKSDQAVTFRGLEWPSFSKSGEVFVFDETPSVVKGLARKETCGDLFSGK